MRVKHAWLIAAVVVLAVSVCWAAGGSKLFINGKVASNNVKVINGTAYVPLRDVANALNMVIAVRPGGYEMTPQGGANQIRGTNRGKIGDEILVGSWRFSVLGVQQMNEYNERYYGEKRTITPQGKGDVLIVVDCRIKNALKKTQSPVLTERVAGNTALADTEGSSYAPLDYDARQAEDKTQSFEGAPLLPGAKADFALVFSVPEGTQPKDLVFTLQTYLAPDKEAKDVRVSLE